MKKIIYLLFGIVLLLPFTVKADSLFTDKSVTCSGSIEKFGVVTCTVEVKRNGGFEGTGIQFEVTSPDPTVFDIVVYQNVTTDGDYARAIYTIAPVDDEMQFATNDDVPVAINVSFTDGGEQKTEQITGSFHLVENESSANSSTQTSPTTGANNTNSTQSTKTSSKDITNPNTADSKVLLLSCGGILMMFIMGVSIKKIKFNK